VSGHALEVEGFLSSMIICVLQTGCSCFVNQIILVGHMIS
jgi:hypothetical protein